ncbi:MAG: HAD family hydrolase [Halioglobus sp.]|nr:HAD family hydrolase [Halioglobus sp.]
MQGTDLYICLLSIHGLIRGTNLELGRDADTGGQTKYVVDLARALAQHPEVGQVDLVTRLVDCPEVSPNYAQPEERLCDNARIVRIECGPAEYIPKEKLWYHLDAFTDNLAEWLHEQSRYPDLLHSHYADAGYVGLRLSNLFGVPLIHTGHSLGRDKRKRLLAAGHATSEINETYNMPLRIDTEEEILANADLVVASTRNEIEEQYGLYKFQDPDRMAVIPPGTDLSSFRPFDPDEDIAFKSEVDRFLADPDKPLILALSRPDERKNILTLIEAYGESEALQEAANLLIVAGNRDDIRDLDDGAQQVLTNILIWIDAYDLYGKVAVPKRHRADEVPEIYRLVAATGGVFINPALTEPFGLTILEAAASGLPVVATENGGPVEIIGNCECGELVDPLDREQIANALMRILKDRKTWERYSTNGIKRVVETYSWEAHVQTYMQKIRALPEESTPFPEQWTAVEAPRHRDRMIVSGLDQSLIGNPESLSRFVEVVREKRKSVTTCIATGRRLDDALGLMKKHGIAPMDILITSLGTRIHYGQNLDEDNLWAAHIDHAWSRRRIRKLLEETPGLELQSRNEQTEFKLSYYCDPEVAPSPDEIRSLLLQHTISANVIPSFGMFLDIVPVRASKGQALRYVCHRLEIPLDQVLVAGGSGADEDMMRGNTLAVVPKNREHEELCLHPEFDRIYFSPESFAAGILDAVEHYDFFGRCTAPDSPAEA